MKFLSTCKPYRDPADKPAKKTKMSRRGPFGTEYDRLVADGRREQRIASPENVGGGPWLCGNGLLLRERGSRGRAYCVRRNRQKGADEGRPKVLRLKAATKGGD
jgi:hypothetical protein